MKKSQKAILLSALVLPGLGQMTLRRHKIGVVLLLTSVASFIVILRITLIKARSIFEQLMVQGVVPDISTITDVTTQVMASFDHSTFNLVVWIFIASWFIGIIDAWLAGKRAD